MKINIKPLVLALACLAVCASTAAAEDVTVSGNIVDSGSVVPGQTAWVQLDASNRRYLVDSSVVMGRGTFAELEAGGFTWRWGASLTIRNGKVVFIAMVMPPPGPVPDLPVL
jgi:hypothetical protein